MKRLPRNIPARYQKEWKEDVKEWRFRKKIRFVNAQGKKVDRENLKKQMPLCIRQEKNI